MTDAHEQRTDLRTPSAGGPVLLTAAETARMLRVSARTLWGWTASHRLRAIRLGRLVRYDARDVAEFIDRHKDKQRPWE